MLGGETILPHGGVLKEDIVMVVLKKAAGMPAVRDYRPKFNKMYIPVWFLHSGWDQFLRYSGNLVKSLF